MFLLVEGPAHGERSPERVGPSGGLGVCRCCGVLLHAQVECAHPLLAGLDQQRRDQALAGLFVGKDPHHSGPAFQLLVLALQHVGRPHALAVRLRQCIHAENLFAMLFQQCGHLRSLFLQLRDGRCERDLRGPLVTPPARPGSPPRRPAAPSHSSRPPPGADTPAPAAASATRRSPHPAS